MSWRPEGWERIHESDCSQNGCECHSDFEAGADAMYQPAYDKGKAEGKGELLEALKGQSVPCDKGEKPNVASPTNGHWCFIPEERS